MILDQIYSRLSESTPTRVLSVCVLHTIGLAMALLSITACKKEEVVPLVFDKDASTMIRCNAIEIKKAGKTIWEYHMDYTADGRLGTLTEVYWGESATATPDTNICTFVYTDNRLSTMRWVGLMDWGIYGRDVATDINYAFEYGNEGQLSSVVSVCNSALSETKSARLISADSSSNKCIVLGSDDGATTDTIRQVVDMSTRVKSITINNFREITYKKEQKIIAVKNTSGQWENKAQLSNLKNVLPMQLWPIIQNFIENVGMNTLERHPSALRPDAYYFFDTYVQDRFEYFPVLYQANTFQYDVKGADLKSIKATSGGQNREIIFLY